MKKKGIMKNRRKRQKLKNKGYLDLFKKSFITAESAKLVQSTQS
jgi:hypothetical protein